MLGTGATLEYQNHLTIRQSKNNAYFLPAVANVLQSAV